MKKTAKIILAALAFTMVIGTSFTAMAKDLGAGQWCNDTKGYWFKLSADGSKFLANTWHWIKDSDGVIRCYYFDKDGWLVTDAYVEGYVVDKDGHWVVNNVIQTGTAVNQDFYHHEVLKKAAAKSTKAKTGTAASINDVKTSGNTLKSSTTKTVKAKSGGFLPETVSKDYVNSSFSGKTITNTWANFKLSLDSISGKLVSESDSGDFTFTASDGSILSVYYVKADNYTAGNTDAAAFAKSYISDKRHAGFSMAANVTFGPYTFAHAVMKKPHPIPSLAKTDSLYFRLVEGTNMMQIISVEQNGSQDFTAALNAMTKAN